MLSVSDDVIQSLRRVRVRVWGGRVRGDSVRGGRVRVRRSLRVGLGLGLHRGTNKMTRTRVRLRRILNV